MYCMRTVHGLNRKPDHTIWNNLYETLILREEKCREQCKKLIQFVRNCMWGYSRYRVSLVHRQYDESCFFGNGGHKNASLIIMHLHNSTLLHFRRWQFLCRLAVYCSFFSEHTVYWRHIYVHLLHVQNSNIGLHTISAYATYDFPNAFHSNYTVFAYYVWILWALTFNLVPVFSILFLRCLLYCIKIIHKVFSLWFCVCINVGHSIIHFPYAEKTQKNYKNSISIIAKYRVFICIV